MTERTVERWKAGRLVPSREQVRFLTAELGEVGATGNSPS
jgi:hypothetical protein